MTTQYLFPRRPAKLRTAQRLLKKPLKKQEEVMTTKPFEQPVSIFVGLGFPHQVDSVLDAYRILSEWHGPRGPAHTAALKACQAALAGDVDPETARGIFVAFARSRGILVPEAVNAAALAALGGRLTA
jgi:hypothetical protein